MIAFRIIRWSVAYVFRAMSADLCFTCMQPKVYCSCPRSAR